MNLYGLVKVLHILAVMAVIAGTVGRALIRARLLHLEDIHIARVRRPGRALRRMVGCARVDRDTAYGFAADLAWPLATRPSGCADLDTCRRGPLLGNNPPRHLGLHSSWEGLRQSLSGGARAKAHHGRVARRFIRPGDSRQLPL